MWSVVKQTFRHHITLRQVPSSGAGLKPHESSLWSKFKEMKVNHVFCWRASAEADTEVKTNKQKKVKIKTDSGKQPVTVVVQVNSTKKLSLSVYFFFFLLFFPPSPCWELVSPPPLFWVRVLSFGIISAT